MQYIATARCAILQKPEAQRKIDDITALIKEFYKSDKRASIIDRYNEIDVLRKAAFLWVGQSFYRWGLKTTRHEFKYVIHSADGRIEICLDLNMGYLPVNFLKRKWAKEEVLDYEAKRFSAFLKEKGIEQV